MPKELLLTESDAQFEIGEYVDIGIQIAEKDYMKEYFEGELAIEDEVITAQTAHMMENFYKWVCYETSNLGEATRSATVSGFVDQIFPVIRTVFPNLILHELVNVQALRQRFGQIFYMDFVVGRDKGGAYTKGQKLFDHRRGYPAITDYTSESIRNDNTGSLGAPGNAFSGQTSEVPVKPNTFRMTVLVGAVAFNVVDDGNGALTGVNITGTLDYERGSFTINHGVANFDAQTFLADFHTDYEINQNLPTIDVQFLATSIAVEEHAIRYRYSMNAAFDFKQEFGGRQLSQLLLSTMSQLLSAEITYLVIQDLWAMAGAAAVFFSLTVPAGVTRAQHYASIVYQVHQIGNLMYSSTQRVTKPTWIICDANAASVLQTIPAPTFQTATVPAGIVGTHKIGTLAGITVYLDPHIQNLPGASAQGNLLLGYRGTDFLDAPYVWAPYQLMASTPETTLDDFMARKAMMSRFGRKRLNNALLLRIDLIP